MSLIIRIIGIGSTHDVTVTDDFDESFQELAISRHVPIGRPVSITEEEPGSFAYDDVKRHTVIEDDDDKDEPLIQF